MSMTIDQDGPAMGPVRLTQKFPAIPISYVSRKDWWGCGEVGAGVGKRVNDVGTHL